MENPQLGEAAPPSGCQVAPLNPSATMCTASLEEPCPTTQYNGIISHAMAAAKFLGYKIQKRFDTLQTIQYKNQVSRHCMEAVNVLNQTEITDYIAENVTYNIEEERGRKLTPGEFVKCLHVDLDFTKPAARELQGDYYTLDQLKTMVKPGATPYAWAESGMVIKEGGPVRKEPGTNQLVIPDHEPGKFLFVYILFPKYQNCFQFVRIRKDRALICSVEEPRMHQGMVVPHEKDGCKPAFYKGIAFQDKEGKIPWKDEHGHMYYIIVGDKNENGDFVEREDKVSSKNWLPAKKGQNFPHGLVPYNRFHPDLTAKDHMITLEQKYPWSSSCPNAPALPEKPFQEQPVTQKPNTPPTLSINQTIDIEIQKGLDLINAQLQQTFKKDLQLFQQKEKNEEELTQDEKVRLNMLRNLHNEIIVKGSEYSNLKAKNLEKLMSTSEEYKAELSKTYQSEIQNHLERLYNMYKIKSEGDKQIANAPVEDRPKIEERVVENIKEVLGNNPQTAAYIDSERFIQNINRRSDQTDRVLLRVEADRKEQSQTRASTTIRTQSRRQEVQEVQEDRPAPFTSKESRIDNVFHWIKYMWRKKCPENISDINDKNKPDYQHNTSLRVSDIVICSIKNATKGLDKGKVMKFVQENPMRSIFYTLVLFGAMNTIHKGFRAVMLPYDRYDRYRDDRRYKDYRRRGYGRRYKRSSSRRRRNTTNPGRRRRTTKPGRRRRNTTKPRKSST